jgi:hypothetical protein
MGKKFSLFRSIHKDFKVNYTSSMGIASFNSRDKVAGA